MATAARYMALQRVFSAVIVSDVGLADSSRRERLPQRRDLPCNPREGITLRTRSKLLSLAAVPLLVVGIVAVVSNPANAAPSIQRSVHVTEHYHGRTFALAPGNWRGAKDCAIVKQEAYCFDTDAEFEAFTSVKRAVNGAVVPQSDPVPVKCNGWAKIWTGANYTNRGLAFQDRDILQYLGDYAPVPFYVKSWFTNGQRGYSKMTNCYGELYDSSGTQVGFLHTNAAATNLGTPWGAYTIFLWPGAI